MRRRNNRRREKGEDREERRGNEEGREDRRERGVEMSEFSKGMVIEGREQTGWKWERKEEGERK